MDDTIPREEDIVEAVMRIRLYHDGGPSGMRAKHLRTWHRAEKQKENPDPGNWQKVVKIIQVDFREGELAAPCAWKTVVMIPKRGGTNFRGIVLM